MRYIRRQLEEQVLRAAKGFQAQRHGDPYAQRARRGVLPERVHGFGDPLFRFSMNFYGAPGLPVDRYTSVKLCASTGTSTRTGSEFDGIAVLARGVVGYEQPPSGFPRRTQAQHRAGHRPGTRGRCTGP